MQPVEQIASDTLPPRCEHCGEVIGVYERLVHVSGNTARETSRAAEPELSQKPAGAYYHAGCLRSCPQRISAQAPMA